MHKYLKMALAYAKDYEYESGLEYNLCAIIVRGGAVVSVGYNKFGTNAFVDHYTDISQTERGDRCMNTHAEMDAILRVRGKIDLTGCKIYVARKLKVNGDAAMARPCEICEHILFNYGIKRAVYTISNEEWGTMKVVNPAKKQHNDDNVK